MAKKVNFSKAGESVKTNVNSVSDTFDEAIQRATSAITAPSSRHMQIVKAPLPLLMRDRSLSTSVMSTHEDMTDLRELAKMLPYSSFPDHAFDTRPMRRSMSLDSAAKRPNLTIAKLPAQITSYEFEKISVAFENYTSSIMTIKTDPNDNPWKTMIWPLALKNPVLFKAVASMSIFHVYRSKDEPLTLVATKLFKQALGELAEGLTSNNIPSEVALATCLVLAIAEGWDTKSCSSGIIHLKGAKSIMKKLTNDQIIAHAKFYKFLVSTFFYYDVLIRMSNSLTVNENDQDGMKLFEYIQDTLKQHEKDMIDPLLQPLFDENLFMASETNIGQDLVDPLLGVSRGLFIILGKVATFISKVRKMDKLSLSIISSAVELKHELSNWKPDVIQEFYIENSDCDLPSCITTAEAYRFSTLLYLQQVVPEITSESSENLANKVLMLIASIPSDSRTNTLHIFPLLMASCETVDPKDRDWVLKRWETLRHFLNLANIEKAVEIIKEVWRRKDLVKKREFKDIPADILESMGETNWDHLHGRIDTLIGTKKRSKEGINSWTHWSTVMKEWNWEVTFG